MSETINGRKIFSLFEVTHSIQKTIAERYKTSYWIKAEMNKLNHYPQSGHCYPDLVEKKNGKVIAQIRCNLWKDDYKKLNNSFLATLKEPIKDGIKILFLATISFHSEHGLSLRILDIDPSYTLGDLEKEKQETIQRLQQEGIFNRNKITKLPLLPQRIAIISVDTSKGYKDFCGKIDNNNWGYAFFHMLFPAVLQGDKIISSISYQLKRIEKVKDHFDVVAIIRGGGGDVGLSSYNNFLLAKEVAMFPIPVLTGIGHITNVTVVEMVSHKNLITPTDLADFLLQEFHNFSVPVQKGQEKIIDKSKLLISETKSKFQSEVKLFQSVTRNILIKNKTDIRQLTISLIQQSQFTFRSKRDELKSVSTGIKRETIAFCKAVRQEIKQFSLAIKKDVDTHIGQFKLRVQQAKEKLTAQTLLLLKNSSVQIDNTEKNISNMSPQIVLKRGYSITLLNGKAVKNINQVKSGDTLKTTVFHGNIISTVKFTSQPDES